MKHWYSERQIIRKKEKVEDKMKTKILKTKKKANSKLDKKKKSEKVWIQWKKKFLNNYQKLYNKKKQKLNKIFAHYIKN